MSNLRIVYDNLVDRGTVTASSTAGTLAAANLQTDTKSDVWRATGIAASINAAWPAADAVQAVALPFCNLSPTATMRVRVTSETSATNLQTYSETGTGWSAAGSTPPTVTNGSAYLGLNAVKLDFTSAMTAGYAGCRAVRSTYAFGISIGQVYATSAFISLSRPLTGSEAIAMYATGTYALPTAFLNSANSAAYVGAFKRLSAAPGTVGIAGGDYFVVYVSGALTSPLTVYVTRLQAELDKVTSYYPSGAAVGVRPTGYIDSWQTYDYDSGVQLACPAPALRPRGWTAAQAASAYAYGGGAYGRMWLPVPMQATGVAIDIVDANNLQGYIEAARLIVGPYWSPTYNASEASMSVVDTTELYRTDAGDQGANAGYQYRRVPVSLSAMPAADRAAFVNIVRNSRAAPNLLSVFPESADLALERDHMVYGRRSKDSDVAIQYAASYSTAVEIEEI